jgi:hypothetical protein
MQEEVLCGAKISGGEIGVEIDRILTPLRDLDR